MQSEKHTAVAIAMAVFGISYCYGGQVANSNAFKVPKTALIILAASLRPTGGAT